MPRYCPACGFSNMPNVAIGCGVVCPKCQQKVVPDPSTPILKNDLTGVACCNSAELHASSVANNDHPTIGDEAAVVTIPEMQPKMRVSGFILGFSILLGCLASIGMTKADESRQLIYTLSFFANLLSSLFFSMDSFMRPDGNLRRWLIALALIGTPIFITTAMYMPEDYGLTWLVFLPIVMFSVLWTAFELFSWGKWRPTPTEWAVTEVSAELEK